MLLPATIAAAVDVRLMLLCCSAAHVHCAVLCYQESSEASELKHFANKNNVPLVGELTDESMKERYTDKRPLVVVFYMVDFSFDYRDGTHISRFKRRPAPVGLWGFCPNFTLQSLRAK